MKTHTARSIKLRNDVDAITYPIIHSNGTNRETLHEALRNAYRACRAMREAIKQIAPNGRDYYAEAGRMELALTQYADRLAFVQRLQDHIEAEIEAIDSQE